MKIDKIVTIICIIIMFAIGIGTLASDNKSELFSPEENRMLEGMPNLNAATIVSGEFASGYEKYMIDRIPFRNKIISIQNSISQSMSVVTFEDTLNVIDTNTTQQMEGLDSEEFEETAAPEITTSTPLPQSTPTVSDSAAAPSEAVTYTIEPTATPDPNKFNDSKHKSIGFIDNSIDKTKYLISFETKDVVNYANTLNQLTSLLPDGGNLIHIFCLESMKARPVISCVNDGNDITMIDQTLEVLQYYTPDNAHIISAPMLFEEPLEDGDKMYFFTDHHWTIEGAHYAYKYAMHQIDIEPIEWEDYNVTYEEPFLGGYYKNTRANFYKNNPDTLAILSFDQADTFTHYLGDDNIEELPIIQMNAVANDRYRVYYDGPQFVGPLSTIKTTSNTQRNALIILDSYGLSFSTMLIPHYDNICIMDLRYMYKSTENYYIDDLVKQYNVDDIFIVLGDLNTFGTYYSKSINIYINNPEK